MELALQDAGLSPSQLSTVPVQVRAPYGPLRSSLGNYSLQGILSSTSLRCEKQALHFPAGDTRALLSGETTVQAHRSGLPSLVTLAKFLPFSTSLIF